MSKESYHRRLTRTGIIAICAICAIPLLIFLLVLSFGGSTSYQSPILPMTGLFGTESIEVQRSITLDFSPYDSAQEKLSEIGTVLVSDSYSLFNPTSESITATLAFGFYGQLVSDLALIPNVLVGDSPISAQLVQTYDPSQQIKAAQNWEEYRTAFAENDFLADALCEPERIDTSIIVYHFTDLLHTEVGAEDHLFLHVQYKADTSKTTVLTYGSINTVADDNPSVGHALLQIPTDPEKDWIYPEGYLVVLGEDIQDVTLTGNVGYELTSDSISTKISGNYKRYETTLPAFIMQLAQDYHNWPQYDHAEQTTLYTDAILYNGVMKRLESTSPDHWQYSLQELFHQVMYDEQLLYWIFTVDIPADTSVDVKITYIHTASEVDSNLLRTVDGYDIITANVSTLNFTQQSLSLQNTQLVKILEENIDFSSSAEHLYLGSETERYYIHVSP